MTSLLQKALTALMNRINLLTGLAHPLDADSAKEIFNFT